MVTTTMDMFLLLTHIFQIVFFIFTSAISATISCLGKSFYVNTGRFVVCVEVKQ